MALLSSRSACRPKEPVIAAVALTLKSPPSAWLADQADISPDSKLSAKVKSGGGVLVGVGGTGVLVGGTGVLVGGTGVFVGGTGVLVGGSGVLVGAAAAACSACAIA